MESGTHENENNRLREFATEQRKFICRSYKNVNACATFMFIFHSVAPRSFSGRCIDWQNAGRSRKRGSTLDTKRFATTSTSNLAPNRPSLA